MTTHVRKQNPMQLTIQHSQGKKAFASSAALSAAAVAALKTHMATKGDRVMRTRFGNVYHCGLHDIAVTAVQHSAAAGAAQGSVTLTGIGRGLRDRSLDDERAAAVAKRAALLPPSALTLLQRSHRILVSRFSSGKCSAAACSDVKIWAGDRIARAMDAEGQRGGWMHASCALAALPCYASSGTAFSAADEAASTTGTSATTPLARLNLSAAERAAMANARAAQGLKGATNATAAPPDKPEDADMDQPTKRVAKKRKAQ